MQVVYTGRHAAVEVKGFGRADWREPFEVDDDTAAQLVRQGWQTVEPDNDEEGK